ncbi:MAG: P-loop NTPase [Christensenellales bacterium]|jgi:septum site-determining protein MinD
MSKAWLLASGKGGVGKSSIAAGLAVSLAKRQQHVLLMDADVGLRSLDLMLGMQDNVLYELHDCLSHACTLEEALVQHPQYPLLSLLSAGQSAKPKDFDKPELAELMAQLRTRFDVIIVDGSAGIGRNLKCFAAVVDEIIVVATADEVSLRDAEKTAALLRTQTNRTPFLMLNRVSPGLIATGTLEAPQEISARLDLPLLGAIPDSFRVYPAMLQGQTMAECGSDEVASALRSAARRMQGEEVPLRIYSRSALAALWYRLKGGRPR